MSKSKPSLKNALKSVTNPELSYTPTVPVIPKKTDEMRPKLPPSRQGKKFVGAYFDSEVSKQLKILAAETEKTSQALLGEALNLLFERYRKNPIAEEK